VGQYTRTRGANWTWSKHWSSGGRPRSCSVIPVTAHLFTDASLDEYNPDSVTLVLERTLSQLSRWP
jgi:hypothetical protein